MDETAIAFEPPHVRASATHAGPPLDRISVRDYVRQVEIGAFRSERGVTQRVRFNVVLEVSHHTAAQDDDVDKVISYDTITEAIEHELAAERINLLETLAERVAARCLADPRAVRAFVRIEKLDRIPGSLGVEIVRTRLGDEARRLRPIPPPAAGTAFRPQVVYLSPDLAAARDWRDALAAWGRPFVLGLAPAAPQPPAGSEGQRRIGLLAIEQAAWALADLDPRFSVVGTRTELDWAMKSGRLSVWAPAHMASAAVGKPAADASAPVLLAAWLAETLGAATLVVAGAEPPEGTGIAMRAVARPSDLQELE
jgi:dihydroneopterin aldolase